MFSYLFRPFGFVAMPKFLKRRLWIFWVALIFLAWQYIPASPLFPRPLETARQFVRLYNLGLIVDVWVSLSVIIRSALIAFPLGALLSYIYLIGFFRPPVVIFASFRNISMAAFLPTLMMMHFAGDELKVIITTAVISFYFVSSVIQHFDELPQEEIDHAVCMRMSSWQILWHRVIRGKLHIVCYDFIPCLGMAWSMLSFVEGLSRTEGGLGDLFLQNDKINSYASILALAIISGGLGFGMWLGLKTLVRKTFKYATAVAVH